MKEWCVRAQVLQWLLCMAIPLFSQSTHGDEAEDAAQPHLFQTFPHTTRAGVGRGGGRIPGVAAHSHLFHTFFPQPTPPPHNPVQAWDEEEDACLVALHRQLGPRWPGPAGRLSAQVWAQVQGLVPGRSWQEVRARWDAVLRRGRRKDEVRVEVLGEGEGSQGVWRCAGKCN